ncbi:hypothetical protein [Streptomyces sp. NPDC002690]
MQAQYPSDTYVARSSTPGGKSAPARNDDNELETHAVLIDDTVVALALLSTGVGIGVTAAEAAPRVKSGLVSLKSKLSRPAEQASGTQAPAS